MRRVWRPRKYELIGGITARSGAKLSQYFIETFAVIPGGSLPTEQIERSSLSQLTVKYQISSGRIRNQTTQAVFPTAAVWKEEKNSLQMDIYYYITLIDIYIITFILIFELSI